MAQVFSDYLRALSPEGEPPEPRVFHELWRAMRELLRRELRRRGLWESSPSFLGVDGWNRWEEGAGAEADALDELVAGCYTYVFLERFKSLRAQLRVKSDVEGLVVRSVRNFLHDTQKRRDPLGYRVYVVLRATLASCVEQGRLEIAQGGPKIANDTVFSFVRGAPVADEGLVRGLVPPWNDRLLPELVTGRGEAEKEVRERLADLVLALPAQGVEAFVFRHLIDPLKFDLRARWAALLAEDVGDAESIEEPGELARLMRSIGPDASFEERESFERLIDCVGSGLERLQGGLRQKTHRYLLSLWQFLRVFAAEGGALWAATDELAEAAHGPELPSQRQLAQLLGIPRERLPELFSLLGGVVERCLPPSGAEPALETGWRARSALQKGKTMALRDLQDELRAQTAEAVRRATAGESDGEPVAPPRVGDVFVLPESADLGATWVLVASAPGHAPRFLALAADNQAMRGSADLEVPVAVFGEPLTLRGRVAVWLDAERLAGGVRTGTLGEAVVAQAREKHTRFEAGEPAGTTLERETDADPEYQDWLEELAALAPRIATAEPRRAATSAARGQGSSRSAVRFTSIDSPWAIAAAVLLVVGLGLGGGLWRELALRGELELRLAQTEKERRLDHEEYQARVGALEARIAELRNAAATVSGEVLFNVAMVILQAPGTVRSGGEQVVLAREEEGLAIELYLPLDRVENARYRVELLERASGETRSFEGDSLVESRGSGSVRFVLPRGKITPGSYELSLYREGDPSSRPVARYGLEISFAR